MTGARKWVAVDFGGPEVLCCIDVDVATVLGGAWSKSHQVTLGSRDPAARSAANAVRSLDEAVRGADIVVNAILGAVAVDTISGIHAAAFGDKTLVDVANATTADNGLVYPNSSLAERLQAARPDTRVVKSMNHAAITTIASPGVNGGVQHPRHPLTGAGDG